LRLAAVARAVTPAVIVTGLEGEQTLVHSAHFGGYSAEAIESLSNSKVADATGLYQNGLGYEQQVVVGPPVRLVPILEPLKTRTVSCGDAAVYSRAQTIQVELWSRMKCWEPFQLVGRPLDSETLNSVFGRWSYSDRMFANSGDYSKATDNLDPRLTEYCADEIAQQYRRHEIGPEIEEERTIIRNILFMCLTCHTVLTEKLCCRSWRGAGQVWGQLMGSPVSFPILNIVNFSTTFAALQECNPSLRLHWRRAVGEACADQKVYGDERCILTNGDDILFFCTKEEYGVWLRYVKAAGLSPSVGKNYLSQLFMMINSELRAIPRCWFSRKVDELGGSKFGVLPLSLTSNNDGDIQSTVVPPSDPRWWAGVCQRPGRWRYRFTGTQDLSGLFLNIPALDVAEDGGIPVFHPYVNLGLLRGIERKGADAGHSMLSKLAYPELGPRACALVYGFPEPVRSGLIRKFVFNHDSILRRVPLGCGWHVATSLGGVGIPPPRGHHEGVVNLHCAREVAAGLHRGDLLIPPLSVQAQTWADAALAAVSGSLILEGALKYVPFGQSDSAQRIPTGRAKDGCPCPFFSLWLGRLAASGGGGPLNPLVGGSARERLSGLEKAWKRLRRQCSFTGMPMSEERAWRYGSGYWSRESVAVADLARAIQWAPPSGYGCVNPDVVSNSTVGRSIEVRSLREVNLADAYLADGLWLPILMEQSVRRGQVYPGVINPGGLDNTQ